MSVKSDITSRYFDSLVSRFMHLIYKFTINQFDSEHDGTAILFNNFWRSF